MRDIGIFFVKLSAFLFIGLGASIASIALPLMQYEKEGLLYIYEATESLGQVPDEGVCTIDLAKDSFAECKVGLHMAKKYDSYMKYYVMFGDMLLLLGIISFLFGAALYIKSIMTEKKDRGNGRKTI